jgi:hypothetical protein
MTKVTSVTSKRSQMLIFLLVSPHIYRQGKRASPYVSCAHHTPPGLSNVLRKVLKAVEKKTGQEPFPRCPNRS